jgi:multidrug efflux system outer membrane protein
VAALLLLSVLSGCSLIPALQRPAAPVPAGFAAGLDQTPAGLAASDLQWQEFFQDQRLKRLLELALNNNRDLRVAILNMEQTRAQFESRRADQWPTLNAGITGLRQPLTSGAISTIYTAGLSVTAYELDFFGRLRSLSQAAQEQVLATQEARKSAQISLIALVANTYFSLLADDALLRLTRDTVTTRENSLRLTQLKFDGGAASQLELSQARTLLEGARVALAQLARQRFQDESALVLLVGQPLPQDLPSGLSLEQQSLTRELPAGLPSDLLTRRPDIRQAEHLLGAYNANIGAARAAFFPRISLTASLGVASADLESLFTSGTSAWTFAPQLLMPIFDAGRNQANLAVANVARDIAIAQYEKAIQVGFKEVSDALAARAALADQLQAQSAQLQAEQVRSRLTDLRFQVGSASYLDQLDAQRSLFATQQALVSVQGLQLQNLVTLYKVLGGGWYEAGESAASANR